MERQEFETLVGHAVDPTCYVRIEYVYMNCDLFQQKEDIASFYTRYDMNGIEKIYRALRELRERHADAEVAHARYLESETRVRNANNAYAGLKDHYGNQR